MIEVYGLKIRRYNEKYKNHVMFLKIYMCTTIITTSTITTIITSNITLLQL